MSAETSNHEPVATATLPKFTGIPDRKTGRETPVASDGAKRVYAADSPPPSTIPHFFYRPPSISIFGSGCHMYRNVGMRARERPGKLSGATSPCIGTFGVMLYGVRARSLQR
jgi:hypothetical protein